MGIFVLLSIIFIANVFAGIAIQKNNETSKRKLVFTLCVWLFPIVGILIFLKFRAKRVGEKKVSFQAFILDDQMPDRIEVDGNYFDLKAPDGSLLFDWERIYSWLESLENSADAYIAIRRAWLIHLRDAFENPFRVYETEDVIVLSTQSDSQLETTAEFLQQARVKIKRVLKGISEFSEIDKSVLILLDDNEAYYDYVSPFEESNEAISGGMFIRVPIPHFVARNEDLYIIESTLVHELTHSALNHYNLPVWVDEGLAVNTEQRIVSTSRPLHKPDAMLRKHKAYWNEETIQYFWSGRSFQMSGDAMMLSYELARTLIQFLSQDWESFKRFIIDSNYEDAAEKSAQENCAIDLGESVAVYLEKDGQFGPRPEEWGHTSTEFINTVKEDGGINN